MEKLKFRMNKLIYLLTGAFVTTTSVACTTINTNSNSPTVLQVNTQIKSQEPRTKPATISIEGEKIDVTLKLYDEVGSIFTTYFPYKDFIAESSGSGEGTGAWFYANFGGNKNELAYVHFFFPARATNLENLRRVIKDRRGLIASNGWQVVSRTQSVPYRWAKEKIVFTKRQGNQNITGAVYLGEEKGKAFYVITHYPMEYGDGFGPRANIILENLQVVGG